jgi:acetyl-CoA carboxylase carboxyl transferase subunit beta
MPIKLPSFRPRRDAYPPDLWTKCPSCEEMLFNKQLDKIQRVCPSCGHHFRLSAEARLAQLLDHGSFAERDAGLTSVDPLGFVDQKAYPDRVAAAQLATGMRDAAVWGTGTVEGRPVAICVMDFGFMGGSMGAVVGEKVTRAAEYALVQRLPLIVVSASGGARMQEGTLALMQLAKSVGALERLRFAGVPFISILSDPTTGGVFASFAALGDINVAEPNALIGFAGARVSAGTIAQELPVGFQRSEFLYEHGFLDRVVHRSALRSEVSNLLGYLVPASRRNGVADEAESLGLPAFRPLSFLTNLAERVLPSEPEASPTNGSGAAAATAATARVSVGPRTPTLHRVPPVEPVRPSAVEEAPHVPDSAPPAALDEAGPDAAGDSPTPSGAGTDRSAPAAEMPQAAEEEARRG